MFIACWTRNKKKRDAIAADAPDKPELGMPTHTTCTSCNQCIITILISVKIEENIGKTKKEGKNKVASVVVVNNQLSYSLQSLLGLGCLHLLW